MIFIDQVTNRYDRYIDVTSNIYMGLTSIISVKLFQIAYGNYLYYPGTDGQSKDGSSHQHSIPRKLLLFRRKFIRSEFREIKLS